MIKLQTVGISIEKGVIPRVYRLPFKIGTPDVSIDKGAIPPKNYFKTKLMGVNVSMQNFTEEDILMYSITN
jgi:hypothetical protein